jgi:hypothetical protein
MDLFSLLQTAFAIFATVASVTLIASFIAYKIKHSQFKHKEKIGKQNLANLPSAYSATKGDVVYTVALPEAGTINVVPKPIMTKRKSTGTSANTASSSTNASRFKVVNGSLEAFALNSSFDPVHSLNKSKFNIN